MENKVYIDGNVVVEHGIFYSHDIAVCAGEEYKKDAKVIIPPNGELRITDDYGSIFTYFYIKGDCACFGVNDGDAKAFFDNHKFTHDLYESNISKIQILLNESSIPSDVENVFLQQIYTSIFGALENFLFNTFMRQVCSNYNLYKRVISTKLNILEKYNKADRKILNGNDCLEKEKMFIHKVQRIVFHNYNKVDPIFKTAFGINLGLSSLKKEIDIRHDIVHRIGYTIEGGQITISKEQVLALITKANNLVEKITIRIKEINP